MFFLQKFSFGAYEQFQVQFGSKKMIHCNIYLWIYSSEYFEIMQCNVILIRVKKGKTVMIWKGILFLCYCHFQFLLLISIFYWINFVISSVFSVTTGFFQKLYITFIPLPFAYNKDGHYVDLITLLKKNAMHYTT